MKNSFRCTMIEDIGIKFLKHRILIQMSYWINLMPLNCAIAEMLRTCRHSDFGQNEHVEQMNKWTRPATLFKKVSCTGVFLWILRNF